MLGLHDSLGAHWSHLDWTIRVRQRCRLISNYFVQAIKLIFLSSGFNSSSFYLFIFFFLA